MAPPRRLARTRRALEGRALAAVERVALGPLVGAVVWALDRELGRRLARRRQTPD